MITDGCVKFLIRVYQDDIEECTNIIRAAVNGDSKQIREYLLAVVGFVENRLKELGDENTATAGS